MLSKKELEDAIRCGSLNNCKRCSCFVNNGCIAHDEGIAKTALELWTELENIKTDLQQMRKIEEEQTVQDIIERVEKILGGGKDGI